MNVVLVKSRAGTFIAYSDEDREKLRSIKPGQAVRVIIGRPRNLEHHRRFMACVQFVADHHPDYRGYADCEPLLEVLKKVTRHVRTWTIQSTGEIHEQTLSIAFDAMDEGEFIVWSGKAKPYLVELMGQFPERTAVRLSQDLDAWTHWCLH